ncbi:glycosyltransferase [Oceanobacter sp. 5_MG-2023]|uniref:glycosyltransferase family 2 protein n=1 Tax=Oceanobacter sp. 5_MG-2023 TaxID=3062645 RepID=UPI0026E15F31|nr:glycosyltransferase [Oceanobacter sp. 5_MG-2023]MDO6681329.1 glycosyltransferase [Oceanobacter sp. 5_MG-2023]
MNTAKVSIIISTAGSEERRQRFIDVLQSLQSQTHKNIEVFVVWQGQAEEDFFEEYPDVKFILFPVRNVCRCRNEGAKQAKGDYVWFVDDDTTIADNRRLEYGLSVISEKSLDYIVANVICEGELKALQSHDHDFEITPKVLRGAFSEPGLLFKRDCFMATKFDEGLGIGCIHGSSEGFDLGARLIKLGYKGQVTHDFKLNHPPIKADTDQKALLHRVFFYSMGNALALVKNGYYRIYCYELIRCLVYISIGIVKFNRKKIRTYSVRFLCLLVGPLVPQGDRI